MQFDRMIGPVRVVNAGSVGMPYGAPGPSWALVTPDGVQLRRAHLDRTSAAERIVAEIYPSLPLDRATRILAYARERANAPHPA